MTRRKPSPTLLEDDPTPEALRIKVTRLQAKISELKSVIALSPEALRPTKKKEPFLSVRTHWLRATPSPHRRALSVMVRFAKRLQVGQLPKRATIVNFDDVVGMEAGSGGAAGEGALPISSDGLAG